MLIWMLLCVMASVLGGVAQVLFKIGLSPFTLRYIAAGFGLYGMAFIIYLYALRGLPLTLGYSLIALSYIWVYLMSVYWLGEAFAWHRIAGGVMLVAGVWLISGGCIRC